MIKKQNIGDVALVLAIVLGLTGVVGMSRWMDRHRSPVDANVEEERLYLSGSMVRRLGLGFNGLLADWYWMRSLQYAGRKLLNASHDVQLDDLSSLNLTILAPLLDNATTLDPQFMEPYEFAAVVLPAVDFQQAVRITRKGIDANPNAWRLYQHLGYIYWQRKDFQAAGEFYGRGALIPGAPKWMEAMKARMADEGGSRSTAREIYGRMYEESSDSQVKDMARLRLMQLNSLDERDALRKILAAYQTRTGHCPVSWQEIGPVFRGLRLPVGPTGAPLDPSGTPYVLKKETCEVDLDPQSKIPSK